MIFFKFSLLLLFGVKCFDILSTNEKFIIPEPYYFSTRLKFILKIFPEQSESISTIHMIIPIEEKFGWSADLIKAVFKSSSIDICVSYFANQLTAKQKPGKFNVILLNSTEHFT